MVRWKNGRIERVTLKGKEDIDIDHYINLVWNLKEKYHPLDDI